MKKKSIRKKESFLSKRPKTISLIIVLLLVIGIAITVDQAVSLQNNRSIAAGDCTVTSSQMAISANEQKLFDNINNYRVQNGRAKLTWNDTLNRAASWMSHDIFTTKNVSPYDSLGRSPDIRLFDCGLAQTNQFGEVEVNGADDADEIFIGFKVNQKDVDAMLNPNFTIGAVADESDTLANSGFWTFTAAGPTTTGNPTAPLEPTATIVVPSPACLGNCPSTAPSGGQPSPTDVVIIPTDTLTPSIVPSSSVVPSISQAISGSPQPSIATSITPSGTPPGSGGQQGGLIGLFLAFLLLILQFFRSLFGR